MVILVIKTLTGSWSCDRLSLSYRETERKKKKSSMATVGLAPGLSRKLKKVLDSRTDSPDLLSSLNTLSTFYTENTPQGRRNLRSTVEKRSLSINHEFLQASDAAQQVLPLSLSSCYDLLIYEIWIVNFDFR